MGSKLSLPSNGVCVCAGEGGSLGTKLTLHLGL